MNNGILTNHLNIVNELQAVKGESLAASAISCYILLYSQAAYLDCSDFQSSCYAPAPTPWIVN